MSFAKNLRERAPSQVNLPVVLAVVLLLLVAIGYFVFITSVLMPVLEARQEVAAELATTQGQLLAAVRAREQEPQQLQAQLATAQAELAQAATVFLGEAEAAQVLDRLYQYASESGVAITDLQTQLATAPEEKDDIYDARTFLLQAQSPFPNLVNFVARIREAAGSSVVINSAAIVEGPEQHILSLEVTIYVSPYAASAGGQTSPDATPAPPLDLAQLDASLTQAWDAGDWDRAIALINQILVIDPAYNDMVDKLYVAYVNYGFELLEDDNKTAALAQFEAAVQIRPSGEEALTGLALASATPVPTLTAVEQLAQSLDAPWAEENWERVIEIIHQIQSIDPNYDEITAKLYAAYVNLGYQLARQGRLAEAKEAFIQALAVNPQGGEAAEGLRDLAAGVVPGPSVPPTPVPPAAPQTIYVVRRGDTLFSISRRFGTTVEGIMAANGLVNYNIRAGQQLLIPAQP